MGDSAWDGWEMLMGIHELLMSINFLCAYVYQCVRVLPRYHSKCFSDTKSDMGKSTICSFTG